VCQVLCQLSGCKPSSDPLLLEAADIAAPARDAIARKKGKKRIRAWEDDNANFGSKDKKARHQ